MTAPLRRAAFLDRDGVLNRAIVRDGKPYPPAGLAELEILPDAQQALPVLKAAGLLLIGVTNQPDVARGTQRQDVVEAINAAVLAALPLDDMLVCYHDDRDACACRKPAPGLLLQAGARHRIDVPSSFMIGDRWKDVEAGYRARCTTILIERGYSENQGDAHQPDRTVTSLSEAAAWILDHGGAGGGRR